MNADGGNQRQLTNTRYANAWPHWSPDDSSLVFSSTRDGGDWEIYTMAADGRGARRLTWSPGRDAHPRYFPSGRRLAFQSPRDYAGPREVDLYTMDADGSRQRRLVAAPGFDGVAIPSPDGARIAFQRGRTVRRVTQGMSVRSQASWTQDGRRIAFSAYGTGVDEVYVVNADGTGLVRLTKGTEGMRGD